MKNILIPLIILGLSNTSCVKSCNNNNQSLDASIDANIVDVAAQDCDDNVCKLDAKSRTISGVNWEIILPKAWQQRPPPQPNIQLFAINSEKQNVVLLVREEFVGTYEDYILVAMRSMRGKGVNVTSAKQVVINDIRYVLVESSKDDIVSWAWLTYKDKFGYGLLCGGTNKEKDFHKENCALIAESFSIK